MSLCGSILVLRRERGNKSLTELTGGTVLSHFSPEPSVFSPGLCGQGLPGGGARPPLLPSWPQEERLPCITGSARQPGTEATP